MSDEVDFRRAVLAHKQHARERRRRVLLRTPEERAAGIAQEWATTLEILGRGPDDDESGRGGRS